jgi:hypothetical protein
MEISFLGSKKILHIVECLLNWRLAGARALPSLPGLAHAVLWTVEQLPARHSTTFSNGH